MSSKRARVNNPKLEVSLSPEDRQLFKAAWETARAHHGHEFTFYLPGMIRYGKDRGRYPAISITGDRCDLQCEHCKGKLLEPMLKAEDPARLKEMCHQFARNGAHGILLTGGSDQKGRLPWKQYGKTIKKIKDETALFISAHTGFIDARTATLLKQAGVTQALIDVMGDKETATRVYHLSSLEQVHSALKVIKKSGLELIPHIVAGLNYGKIKAEYKALDIIRRYRPDALVIVVLTPLAGTPMANVSPPSPLEIGRLIANARLLMPEVPISLGCERPRNRDGWVMEKLAILAGANRMAVWSDVAIQEAKNLDLKPRFQSTCCSLDYCPDFSDTGPESL
ncbi:MAG: hypothetical protein KAV87_04700 [Desulfobacteraceae bacterium]|nr:hypothetical protein [Desulfobacteraceae bacterium]